MATIAQSYRDELKDLKREVREAYRFFSDAREKFNETRKFVLKSTLTESDKSNLRDLQRPCLQFNVLEAYVSRLLGEYSKQEPSLTVQAAPLDNPPDADMVDYIEGHLRSIFNEFNSYEMYRDQLTGGYSAIKLKYDYESEMSFNHKISIERVYDPLLVGFDPSAREVHKGDGKYAFEFYPKSEEELKSMYTDASINGATGGSDDGFRWSYMMGEKKVFLLCELYKKKKKRMKIHRLSDNRVVTDRQYKKIIEAYEKNQMFAVPPVPVQTRWSTRNIICCYRFIENELLEYYETDYSILPIIFVDGNSVMIREESENSQVEQVVKPYVENALDSQRLKNLSGQQLANGIELMVQHQMLVALESIPPQYIDQYTNTQIAGNYIYNAYNEKGDPLPRPEPVMKVPLPPEIMNTFMNTDQLVQTVLGSYDASQGITTNQLSGVAIVNGATQSNATAMPYIVNQLASLQQIANGILDLIPKLYVTPRSIPIMTAENKRAFVLINTQNVPQQGDKYENKKQIDIKYSPQDLKVILKPGVNFEVQQQKALDTTLSLAKMLPSFAAIINGKGLPILFENLNIRGADRWRVLAEQQVEMQEQQQKQQQQMQAQGQMPQFNPALQEIAIKQQKETNNLTIQNRKMDLQEEEILNDRLDIINKAKAAHQDDIVQLVKAKTERDVHESNTALKVHDQVHRHASDMIDHAKDIHNMATSRIDAEQQPSENTV